MVVHIPLSKTGKYAGLYEAIVSDEDADLAQLNWVVAISRKTSYAMYRPSKEGKRVNTKMHRVIMQRILGRSLEKGEVVDHINRNGLDNRRENLRTATVAENTANRAINSNNKTGVLGVFKWTKGKGYGAQIGVNGKRIYLGSFDTIEEAKKAREDAEKTYHKDFSASKFS